MPSLQGPVIVDLLTEVKANKRDAGAMDSTLFFFQAALIESGHDVSDPTSLVYRLIINRCVRCLKELGVDLDAPPTEVEIPEGEEEEAEEEHPDASESKDW